MPSIKTPSDISMGPPTQRPGAPSQGVLTANEDVFVNVAGRIYRTTPAVLTKSPYFRYHLTNPASRDSDGCLVVNADPVLFENILQYLQHGVCPLFINAAGFHDYPKYIACTTEARYFHLDRLVDWLERGYFVQAYRIKMTHRTVRGDELEREGGLTSVAEWNRNVLTITLNQVCGHQWGKCHVAICPRGVEEHRGRKDECYKVCFGGQENPVWEYDVIPYPIFSLMRKKLAIDHNILRDHHL